MPQPTRLTVEVANPVELWSTETPGRHIRAGLTASLFVRQELLLSPSYR